MNENEIEKAMIALTNWLCFEEHGVYLYVDDIPDNVIARKVRLVIGEKPIFSDTHGTGQNPLDALLDLAAKLALERSEGLELTP